MERRHLITKETAKLAAQGQLMNDQGLKNYEGSINDAVESFLNKLSNWILYSKDIQEEEVWSFFTPELTEHQLKLVEEENKEHLKTYFSPRPDVDSQEMKKSESKSKHLHAQCWRKTIYLKKLL